MPTRAEVRAFGARTGVGDVFHNRYQEHDHAPHTRRLTVVQDVPGRAYFLMRDETGKVRLMRARTLMTKYEVLL